MLERELLLERPIDPRATLSGLRVSGYDPTTRLSRIDGGWRFERASRTPDGPGSLQLETDGERVAARAWGPGGPWLLEVLPGLLGQGDRGAFTPEPRLLRDLAARATGLRLPRFPRVVELLVPTVLAQLVTTDEARRGFSLLVHRHGEPAPGPLELHLQPAPETLARMSTAAFTPLGVLLKQARTIGALARRASRLEEAASMDAEACARRLTAIPGIGPWTAGSVMLKGLGHADAVPVGDYHLPNLVAWALAGEPRADDRRMLELLEPYRPHRGRVCLLLARSGRRAPSFGPRMPIRPLPSA